MVKFDSFLIIGLKHSFSEEATQTNNIGKFIKVFIHQCYYVIVKQKSTYIERRELFKNIVGYNIEDVVRKVSEYMNF